MKHCLLSLIALAFLAGCATTHPGHKATSLDSDGDANLIVSSQINKEFSDTSNIYVEFTFENKSYKWIKVDSVDLDFANVDHVDHNVIVGKDLEAWLLTMKERKKTDNFNDDLLASGLLIGGLLLSTSNDTRLQSIGAASAIGSVGWLAVRGYKEGLANAQESKKVPETHLLAPFTIPSQNYIRRWLLLNVPQGRFATNITMTLNTVEGQKLRFKVPIEK